MPPKKLKIVEPKEKKPAKKKEEKKPVKKKVPKKLKIKETPPEKVQVRNLKLRDVDKDELIKKVPTDEKIELRSLFDLWKLKNSRQKMLLSEAIKSFRKFYDSSPAARMKHLTSR
tara:strand:- start:73 stop:417 length:345 start_codon:yes stop_codon:yes gene_type:complete